MKDVATTWSPEMTLGVPAMDKAHEAFLYQLHCMLELPSEEFPAAFKALTAEMERDFQAEEELMERIDYPGIREHLEQHARVLGSMHQVMPAVMEGNIALGRRAVELLPKWFMFHLSTMDTALALALDLGQAECKGG